MRPLYSYAMQKKEHSSGKPLYFCKIEGEAYIDLYGWKRILPNNKLKSVIRECEDVLEKTIQFSFWNGRRSAYFRGISREQFDSIMEKMNTIKGNRFVSDSANEWVRNEVFPAAEKLDECREQIELIYEETDFEEFVHPGNPFWTVRGIQIDGVNYIEYPSATLHSLGVSMRGGFIGGMTDEDFKRIHISESETTPIFSEYGLWREMLFYFCGSSTDLFKDWIFSYVFPNIGKKIPSTSDCNQTFKIHTFESRDIKPIRAISIEGVSWFFAMDVYNAFSDSNKLPTKLIAQLPEKHKRLMNFNYLHAAVREAWMIDSEGAEEMLALLEAKTNPNPRGYIFRSGKWWNIVCFLANEVQESMYADFLSHQPQEWKKRFEKIDKEREFAREAESKKQLEEEIAAERLAKEQEIAQLKREWAAERDQQMQDQMMAILKMFEMQSKKIDLLTELIANNQQQSQSVNETAQLFENLATFFKTKGVN